METNSNQKQAWFVLSDSSQARLMRCGHTPNRRFHLTEIDWIKNEAPERERGRPNALGGMTGHSYAADHHAGEEDLRRFAIRLAHWVDQQIEVYGIEHLTIFAPAREFEPLRTHIHHDHLPKIELRTENLVHLPQQELEHHETVIALLNQHPGGKPTRVGGYVRNQPIAHRETD